MSTFHPPPPHIYIHVDEAQWWAMSTFHPPHPPHPPTYIYIHVKSDRNFVKDLLLCVLVLKLTMWDLLDWFVWSLRLTHKPLSLTLKMIQYTWVWRMKTRVQFVSFGWGDPQENLVVSFLCENAEIWKGRKCAQIVTFPQDNLIWSMAFISRYSLLLIRLTAL